MTIELRRLAEAAIAEEAALDADERARVVAESDDIHSGMDDWLDFDDIPPAHMAWYSAASPRAVLALLDEVDRLRSDLTKPTAPAYVHMLTKSLRSLRDVAPEGDAFVIVTMPLKDARRVPLFSETIIGLRDEPDGGMPSGSSG